jgi:hypothetical protein
MNHLRLAACVSVALVALSASASGTTSALAAGNSGANHACQQGGYLALQRADGTGFKNTGDCVSYAAHGGVLFNPTLTLKQTDARGDYSVVGTGFHANSAITLIRTYQPTGDVFNRTDWATGPAGAFSTSLWACYTRNTSVVVTVLDAAGVHKTASLAVRCP